MNTKASFVVLKGKGYYIISTKNLVNDKDVEGLKHRINYINSLDKQALNSIFKATLNDQTYSSKGGGGLGLINIARRSENRLVYNFSNHHNGTSLFDLSVLIS